VAELAVDSVEVLVGGCWINDKFGQRGVWLLLTGAEVVARFPCPKHKGFTPACLPAKTTHAFATACTCVGAYCYYSTPQQFFIQKKKKKKKKKTRKGKPNNQPKPTHTISKAKNLL
jgi:hypothetical protein